MTNEEALKSIEEDGIKLGAGDFVEFDALIAAKKALEKQIPKKPMLITIHKEWICPRCQSTHEMNYEEYLYCPNCGQAIDWTE